MEKEAASGGYVPLPGTGREGTPWSWGEGMGLKKTTLSALPGGPSGPSSWGPPRAEPLVVPHGQKVERDTTVSPSPYGMDYTKEWAAVDRMAKPVIMPGKYDGSGHLTEYLAHFDLCRRANGWDHEQAGVFLGLSLTGIARRLLSGIDPGTEGGYLQLRAALVARFQPDNQGGTYKAILRTKERGQGECLQAYAEEIERYTRLAYPRADIDTVAVMAKDRFIEGLKDQQMQFWIYQTNPESLRDAVQTALHAEACMQPFKSAPKARAANSTMAEQLAVLTDEVKRDREEAKKRSSAEPARPRGGKNKQGYPDDVDRCYHCAERGHRRHECPGWRKIVANKRAEEAGAKAPAVPPPASGN